jgi:hypothetical protein
MVICLTYIWLPVFGLEMGIGYRGRYCFAVLLSPSRRIPGQYQIGHELLPDTVYCS